MGRRGTGWVANGAAIEGAGALLPTLRLCDDMVCLIFYFNY
jgi:hypothetical protein